MDRPNADAERVCDFFVQKSFTHMIQDFLFSGGKIGQPRCFIAWQRESEQTLKIVPDLNEYILRGKDSPTKCAPDWLK